jgi:cell division protein ZapA
MPTVTVSLAGRNYDIACGPGEEARVQDMAVKLRPRLEEIGRSLGFTQDSFVLAVAALLLTDELDQRESEVQHLRLQQMENSLNREAALAETIERLADRIEALAARLEAA